MSDFELQAAFDRGRNECPEYFNDEELHGLRAVQDAVIAAVLAGSEITS